MNHRLAGAGWLALLSALGFSAVCAVIWMNSDQIIAWLLAQGMVEEASTSKLPAWVNRAAFRAAFAGLLAAGLIILRAVFGIYPWSPLLAAANYLERLLRPMTRPILHRSIAGLHDITNMVAEVARFLGNRLSVIWLSVWTSASAAGHLAVIALALASHLVKMAIFAPLNRARMVLSLVIRNAWMAVSARLAQVYRWISSLVIQFGQAAVTATHQLGHKIAALIRPIALLMSALGQLAWRALIAANVSLVNLAQSLGAILRYLEVTFTTAVRHGIAYVRIPLS